MWSLIRGLLGWGFGALGVGVGVGGAAGAAGSDGAGRGVERLGLRGERVRVAADGAARRRRSGRVVSEVDGREKEGSGRGGDGGGEG